MTSLSERPSEPGRLLRWYLSSATLNMPQAAGPVAFAFLALSLTGATSGGAAMMLAMVVAQVVGAVPITRLGRHVPPGRFLRRLVAFRTAALVGVAALAAAAAPFAWIVAGAAVAGSVNGAAYGTLRAMVNRLTPSERLPRALGISATLNEVTFVLAPVAASGLGTVSPTISILVVAALGAIPALVAPRVDPVPAGPHPHGEGAIVGPAILLWLVCSAASGAAVASIEIGAVALALAYGYEPALAILFTVPLCVASVSGGIWVSVRNRAPTPRSILAQLSLVTLGAALTAFGGLVETAVAGAILMGSVLAPLATTYSLVLDALAPPRRRPEVFALLRTANALGVILASALLTLVPLPLVLTIVTVSMATMTVAVAIATAGRPLDRPGR